MAIHGDLKTMSLVELLQWAAAGPKSGVLELERHKSLRRIAFRDGRIVGCSAEDPSMLLGQFLISRGKISRQVLQAAMKQQEDCGRGLPEILVEDGLLTTEEMRVLINEKTMETIHGLFDWEDAVFRFQLGAELGRHCVDVDLSVEETLLQGAVRRDELGMIRRVFESSGLVLRRTEAPLPSEVCDDPLLPAVLDLVDEQRTLAEIVLQVHASEYLVLKLLFLLHESGSIEIVEECASHAAAPTLLEVGNPEAPAELPSLEELSEPGETGAPTPGPADLQVLVRTAAEKTVAGDHESALTILDACYRALPHDESVRRQIVRAESAYLETLRRELLPSDAVPIEDSTAEAEVSRDLTPSEASVLSLIDGHATVQSIVWTAPLREFEVMRMLWQLHAKGLIRISPNLEHAVHLDHRAQRQAGDADRGTGVSAELAPQLEHQVRAAVDDPGMTGEGWLGVDETADPDDPGDVVESGQCRSRHGDQR
jgi:hypothetical protein